MSFVRKLLSFTFLAIILGLLLARSGAVKTLLGAFSGTYSSIVSSFKVFT